MQENDKTYTAKLKYLRVTPLKARRIAKLIRGKKANDALDILRFQPQAVSEPLEKLLRSNINNFQVKNESASDTSNLIISEVLVDEGPTQKRLKMRAKGRADRMFKKSSHITITLINNVKEEIDKDKKSKKEKSDSKKESK
ncbi:MAG: 50S ribosomal protein L22 [Bifidobacteriaceae bacterium]|jgi:large subunit ribosomal protein L22|nr:50S ribosomal protein L22 [Bifidobacteriaceae bacterium]